MNFEWEEAGGGIFRYEDRGGGERVIQPCRHFFPKPGFKDTEAEFSQGWNRNAQAIRVLDVPDEGRFIELSGKKAGFSFVAFASG